MMKSHINKVVRGEDLTRAEMDQAMRLIMSGRIPVDEIMVFLDGLRTKRPTVEEIVAAADVMNVHCLPVRCRAATVFDLVGTGGDRKHTFNISTISALIIASAGVTVAKHGNRAASSRCGSADVLEALGVTIALTPAQVESCLNDIGMAFLFAQAFHPSMRHVAPARKQLGKDTIFNLLGPIANPARPTHQMIGVYDRYWLEPLAEVLRERGLRHAMVVHAEDGMDEISTAAVTWAVEWDGKSMKSFCIDPRHFGIALVDGRLLEGGDAADNAKIVRAILDGEPGPRREAILLNAGVGLYVADRVASVEEGIRLAAERIDSGAARATLERFIMATQQS